MLALAVGLGYAADWSAAPLDPRTPARLALIDEDLAPATDCADLLHSYVRRGVEAVTAYGWDRGIVTLEATSATRDRTGTTGATTTRATRSPTGTNVQETGVDEPDVVKADGEHLYRVWDDVLEVYDVSGTPVRVGQLVLAKVRDAELLLAGDRLVVLGRDRVDKTSTRVLTVDASDATEPTVVSDRLYAADLLEARLHDGADGTVRLVLAPHLPDLDFVQPRRRVSWREAERTNRAVVRRSDIGDWLPTADGEPLLDCADVAIPADDDTPLGTVAVVAFGPGAPGSFDVTGVAAGGQVAYFSEDRMYLAEQSLGWGCCWAFDGPGTGARVAFPAGGDDGVTQLFSFALDGGRTTYVASGEVEGALADRWSMDSADGVLRLAVGQTRRTGPASSVITLREDGSALVEVGRLDGLGRGEDITSVRWFDDLAIVVTFRQVDPLYTVDLSDVEDPRLLGTLKIPGLSEYLHPLGPNRLIGIGQDADRRGRTRGAQAALFDVHDLTRTRQLDVVAYPRGSRAGVATDPRQFTWLPGRRIALTAVSRGRIGWVSVLQAHGGRLHSRLVAVEDGTEVAAMRTVPLPGGRVALVTSEDVRLLDLG